MKRISIIASVIAVSLAFVSCDQSLLDIEQHGVIPVDATYENADDLTADELISQIFCEVKYLTMGDWGVDLIATCAAKVGDAWPGGNGPSDGTNYQLMSRFNDTAQTSQYMTMYRRFYRIIYKSNLIVEKLNDGSPERKRVIAEAKAWRAWSMMHLTQLWGSAPLVTHTLDGIEYSFTPSNTPAEESWKWIMDQFEEAAADLPTKAGLGGQKIIGGRWTKEACYAFKGKGYMWQNDYANAKTELAKVISSGKYALWTKTANMADYGTNMLLYKKNQEAEGNTWIDGSADYVYNTVWRYDADFCDEFLLELDIDGDANMVGNLDPYWFRAYMNWRNNHIYEPANTTHNDGWGFIVPTQAFALAMAKHDGNGPRRRATICTWDEYMNMFPFGDAKIRGVITGAKYFACEGYLRMKWYDFLDDVNEDRYAAGNAFGNRTNFPLLRYSDVLLLYAEAVCQSGSEGNAGISGLQALNMVRSRAGLDDAPALDMNNETYGIKAERRFELWLEDCNRYVDLIRWGDYKSFVTDNSMNGVGPYWGAYVPWLLGMKDETYSNLADPTDMSNYELQYDAQATRGSWDDKFYLLPFPYQELQLNKELEQNPGWERP